MKCATFFLCFLLLLSHTCILLCRISKSKSFNKQQFTRMHWNLKIRSIQS
jgi:hypothetical protein